MHFVANKINHYTKKLGKNKENHQKSILNKLNEITAFMRCFKKRSTFGTFTEHKNRKKNLKFDVVISEF